MHSSGCLMCKPAHEESNNAPEHQERSTDGQPDQRRVPDGFAALFRRALEASPQLALPQKSVVVPLEEVRLDLAHGVEHHANHDEDARAAEKLRRERRDASLPGEHRWEQCDHQQEHRSGESQPCH